MRKRLRLHHPRRPLLLFLFTMLIPCAMLVALGLGFLQQEVQLEAQRRAENRQVLIERTRHALSLELEEFKLREVRQAVSRGGRIETTLEPPVALVAALRDGTLLLPWEHAPAAMTLVKALDEGPFADLIRRAELLESAAGRYDEAARLYRVAASAEGEPVRQVYARLLLARTLQKGTRSGESRAEFERLLATPPDLVDEDNVPVGLYAASRLVGDGASSAEPLRWIRAMAGSKYPLATEALRIARDMAMSLEASDLASALNASLRDRDQADGLQRDFGALAVARGGRELAWVPYGDPVWLIGVTPQAGTLDGVVVAVRAAEALERLHGSVGETRLASSADVGGHPLGDAFPGVRVVLPPAEPGQMPSRRPLLAIGLLLALALTGAAGSLLWRDVQRELHVSEMRSQFVASVSHELRTPLAAIRMFTETLKLDEDVDHVTRSEYLDTILHESERLSRLVDNVLDFGKIERGQKTYRFETVQLDEVVSKAVRTARYPLERAGFSLDIVIEPALPGVQADSDALQQAVLNLLSNAMKYSGNSRRIDLRLDRQNGDARIHVIDRGLGIAAGDHTRVFDRFYRVACPENQHIPGTGLGLTIVAHVAHAHGGAVDVESQPGRGSIFTLRLPLDYGSRQT